MIPFQLAPYCCTSKLVQHVPRAHKLHIDAQRLFQLKGVQTGWRGIRFQLRLGKFNITAVALMFPLEVVLACPLTTWSPGARRAAELCTMKGIIYLIIEDFPLQPSSL